MKESLFREKSLERLSSPEKTDDYMKVTGSGMRLVIGAVILLLAAGILWSITGKIETALDTKATAVIKDEKGVTVTWEGK